MSDAVRQLGRSGVAVPRVIWRLPPTGLPRACAALLRGVGHRAVIVPHDFDHAAAGSVPSDFALVLETDADGLRRQGGAAVIERLHAFGRSRCHAVCVSGVDTSELKAGWPTHRFQQLRERGVSRALLIATDDPATAAWAAAHSTAAGVVARYDPDDQSLAFHAFAEAAEAEAAVLATTAAGVDRSLSFRTGDPRVTAAVEQVPATACALAELLADAVKPWTNAGRTSTWESFADRVPAPHKARGGHMPEE